MTRTYGQYCGLARALDVVGDRWTLLIVRQLLLGPARYSQLQDGLPGVATNLLADRLRDLEEVGIVERRLSHEANATVYALTPWGAELREPIEALIRWSTPLMVGGPEGDTFHAEWLVLALRALLAGKPMSQSATVGIEIEDQLISLRATSTGVEVDPRGGDGEGHAAVMRADPSVILGLATGELTFEEVADLVTIDGDEKAAQAAFDHAKQTQDRIPREALGVKAHDER